MSKNIEYLSKRTLILICCIFLSILILGLLFLVLGYNEAFYIENDAVQSIFLVFTFFGDKIFYIIIISILLFVYNKKFAKNLGLFLLSSSLLNFYLKELFQDPRPATNEKYHEEGYGFPSGHSQMSLDVYSYIGYEFKDITEQSYIVPMILSGLIFLIAISRIILGVHDLQDIIGGILIGIGVLLIFFYLEPIFSKKIGSFSFSVKILLSFIVPILVLVQLLLYLPQGESIAQIAGFLLGFSLGYVLEGEYVKYEPSSITNKQKAINLAIGLVILLVSYLIFKLLIEGTIIHEFIRNALLAIIITSIIPFIFTKINKA